MRIPSWLAVTLLAPLAFACATPDDSWPGPETYSLLGEPLERPKLYPEKWPFFEERLAAAVAYYEEDPTAEGAHVWLGRYQAYLGRYREAISTYSRGLTLHRESYKLLRHRGHRYITLRQFPLAVRDLLQASVLMASTADSVEPDGMPNERNEPRSTYHGNVWYHLGLAYYLQGAFDRALPCYINSVELAGNDDMLCAATHWLVMTLRRMGRAAEAREHLARITTEMDVIENHQYHRLLLLAKGEVTVAELERELDDDGVASATLLYGVANWHFTEGNEERAVKLFERIVDDDAWPAFGHIAAEADLARLAASGS